MFLLVAVLSVAACRQETKKPLAPWEAEAEDSTWASASFDLPEIEQAGEMILLTTSGPQTCYDYRGRKLGVCYMLAQKLADTLGVKLRVELCRDTLDVQRRLKLGDGDLSVSLSGDAQHTLWAVAPGKPQLSRELRRWYQPQMLAQVKQEEAFLLSSKSVRRRIYSPMLDRKGGVISRWDGLFIKYSKALRWDWRLMAAQCYQESTFDPDARSWAGACGLMQIMPSTADQLGLERSRIMQPEDNVAAAARLLAQLEGKFGDISPRSDRLPFVLASYNGGYHHVRDAMALTRKHGRDPNSWEDVKTYILALQQPQFYNDSVVHFGYLRGSETAAYVDDILARWRQYRKQLGHRR